MRSLIAMAAFGFSALAWGAPDPRLVEHFSARLAAADEAFQQACSEAEVGGEHEELPYELAHVFVSFAPTATFGISKVLGLEVAPEITLVWEKTSLE